MITDIRDELLPDKDAVELWNWWRDGERHATPRKRSDFDPTEYPRVLPGITLFEVERNPWRFRIRLVGTRIAEETGLDTTGYYLDELPNTEKVAARARWAAETRKPYFLPLTPVTWTPNNFKLYATLALPLVDDCGATNMILYYMSFANASKEGK
jgi:hypothetical protein